MRCSALLLPLCLLPLAALATDCGAQSTTRIERIAGKDQRGKYDISWLQLTTRFPNPVRTRINTDLEKEARSHICPANAGPDMDAEFSMKLTYMSPDVLGVSTAEDSFCGGAHPVHGTRSLLYDMRTGARLELEHEMGRADAFRRFVDRRVLAARPSDAPEECSGAYEEQTWGYIYILGPRTLSVTQDYPNVIMACGYTTDIPLHEIVPFLKRDSPLQALVPNR